MTDISPKRTVKRREDCKRCRHPTKNRKGEPPSRSTKTQKRESTHQGKDAGGISHRGIHTLISGEDTHTRGGNS